MKKFIFVFLTIFFIGPFTSKVDALFTSEASFIATPIYTATTSNLLDYRIHDIVYEEGGHVSAQLTLTNKVNSQIPIMLEGNYTNFSKTKFNLAPNSNKTIEVNLLVPEGKSKKVKNTFQLIGFTGGYINEHLTVEYNVEKLIYPEETLEVPEQENTEKEDLSGNEGIEHEHEHEHVSSEGIKENDSSNESEDLPKTTEEPLNTSEQGTDEVDSEEIISDVEVVTVASLSYNSEQEVLIDCSERGNDAEVTENEKEYVELQEPNMIETDKTQLKYREVKCKNKDSMPVQSEEETSKVIAVRKSEKLELEEVKEDNSEQENIIIDEQ
ncbi:hypothetical protein [Alkalihalobacterium chitinilyticum]|uniref:DUF916 domain-containing protein n=1 Tax=Alkalihalobacterium chitinilyticum TaxID=2980103 RepID=A0ABT5VIP5_9BACI|nr:hypothetical protein [Alkalihalobacterium chitinilyticum]MDE5414612.1 hypothetical protein [Alkalihalobacterium chitinilyticum]